MARGTLVVVLTSLLPLMAVSGCMGDHDAGGESLDDTSDAATGTSGGIEEDLQNALNKTKPPANVTTPRWWTLPMNNLSADGTIAGFIITIPRDALVPAYWGEGWDARLEVAPFPPEGTQPDDIEYWGVVASRVVDNESVGHLSLGRHRLQTQVGSGAPVTEPASQTPVAFTFGQDSNASDMALYIVAIVDAPSLREFGLLVRVRSIEADGDQESLSEDVDEFLYRVHGYPTTVLAPVGVGSGVHHALFELREYSGPGYATRSVEWSDDVEVELTPAGSAVMSSRQLVLRSTFEAPSGWSQFTLWRGELLSEGKWSLQGQLHDQVVDTSGVAAAAPWPANAAHGTIFGSGTTYYFVEGEGGVDLEYRLDVRSIAPNDWMRFDLLTLGIPLTDLFGLQLGGEYGSSSSGLVGEPPI